MATTTQSQMSFGSVNKRPPFSVEFFNDELPQLTDQEREHRRHQFKVGCIASSLLY